MPHDDLTGGTVSLRSQRAKVVILAFWNSWCGSCRRELALLEKAQTLIGQHELTIFAVSFQEDPAAWSAIRKMVSACGASATLRTAARARWADPCPGIRERGSMRYLAALVPLIALMSTALADTFRLQCVDSEDGKTRLALIEINTDAATIQVYSESTHEWKTAVNVSIADSTISYVEHAFNDTAEATSVTINRVTGKYFAYTAHSARKDGECRKVPSDRSF